MNTISGIQYPLYYEHVKEGYRSRRVRIIRHTATYDYSHLFWDKAKSLVLPKIVTLFERYHCLRFGHFRQPRPLMGVKECVVCHHLIEGDTNAKI